MVDQEQRAWDEGERGEGGAGELVARPVFAP